jgi:signal transduction histidine kinase
VDVLVESTGARASVTVRDRGIGISPDDQRRIFERFERAVSVRHYGGFGVGLWLARQAVEAHGGAIHVRSEDGEGSEFRIELPLEAAPA